MIVSWRVIGIGLGLVVTVVSPAGAQVAIEGGAGLQSVFIDRGEQLGPATLTAEAAVSTPLGAGEAYAALFRITPLGSDGRAFDDELDYTLGYAFDLGPAALDLSANQLTFPGEETDSSLELALGLSPSDAVDVPLAPELLAYHDADLEDWGLELIAGPGWESRDGLWTGALRARLGFVDLGDGSATRTYTGIEASAERGLGNAPWMLGGFIRADFADEDSFADEIRGGEVTEATDSSIAAGIVISAAFDP